MTASTPGLLKKWLLPAALALAIVFLAVSWLPFFVEQAVLPRILVKSGLAGYRITVHRFGIDGCSLQLTGRPDNFSIVTAGNIRIQWTLPGLLQKRLDSLALDGLHVHHYVNGSEGRPTQNPFPEMPVEKMDRTGTPSGTSTLPIIIDTISISNSILFLHDTKRIRILPFSLSGQLNKDQIFDEANIIRYEIQTSIGGQGCMADISYNPVLGILLGTLTGKLDLPLFAKTLFVQEVEGDIAGRADLAIETEVHFFPFSLEKLQVTASSRDFQLTHDALRISTGRFSLESHCTWQPDNKENELTVSILFQGENLILSGPGMQSGIPEFRFDGMGKWASLSDRSGFELTGGLLVEDGFIELEEQDVRVEEILLDLPIIFPWKESGRKGELRAEHITMRQFELGRIRGELMPQSSALEFNGEVHSTLLPKNTIEINGAFRVPGDRSPFTELSCRAENALVAIENFKPFTSALNNITGSGIMDMAADLVFGQDGLDGQLDLELRKAGLEIPDVNMVVEDINMRLHFPDLPTLRSSPEQKLSIGRVTSRNLSVTGINTVFQMESPQSLFVEKIGGRWSGGRVFTSSFRLRKDKPELEVAFFCDRLELAQVLSQMGLAEAEGSGKVSGRIPVLYRNNEIFIDDGFLFSTPGEKGNLKIKKSEQLTAGIPEDVPQFSPIHFAGAALRDFEYNWAKLLLVSEEDNFVLKLQIDGKPSTPLPYRFDSQQNVFVKINDKNSGGISQPIKLDVNFNVPLNELLRYQTTILPILRNIK